MRIVGSGALNLDLFYEVEDLRPFGLEPGGEVWGSREEFLALKAALKREGRFITASGGGSAANTIYALKSWGFETGFIGIVGEDEEGEQVLAELYGVELSRVVKRGRTGLCLIVLDAQRDRAIFVSPHSDEEALLERNFSTTKEEWLHLSSLVTDEGFSFHLGLKEKHLGPVSLDPGEVYARRGKGLLPLLRGAEVLFLTEQELLLLGEEALTGLAKRICLKRGRAGARLFDGATFEVPPARAPKVVDNTGAGDVFDAGVLAGLLSGLGLAAAGRLAADLAALSLRDYGRRGYPTRAEFEERRKFYEDAGRP